MYAVEKKKRKAKQKLFEEHIQALQYYLEQEPDLFLHELATKLK